jgi:hypothetical protein
MQFWGYEKSLRDSVSGAVTATCQRYHFRRTRVSRWHQIVEVR